jgi:hypothetical protein
METYAHLYPNKGIQLAEELQKLRNVESQCQNNATSENETPKSLEE